MPALSACMTPGFAGPAAWTTTPDPWLPPPEVWSTPQPTRSNSSSAATPLPVTLVVPRTTELPPACDDVMPSIPEKIALLVRRTVIFIRSHCEVPSLAPVPPANLQSLIADPGTGHWTEITKGDAPVAEIVCVAVAEHVPTGAGNRLQWT